MRNLQTTFQIYKYILPTNAYLQSNLLAEFNENIPHLLIATAARQWNFPHPGNSAAHFMRHLAPLAHLGAHGVAIFWLQWATILVGRQPIKVLGRHFWSRFPRKFERTCTHRVRSSAYWFLLQNHYINERPVGRSQPSWLPVKFSVGSWMKTCQPAGEPSKAGSVSSWLSIIEYPLFLPESSVVINGIIVWHFP